MITLKSGKEFGLLMAAILLILSVGQLYMPGFLIPKITGIQICVRSGMNAVKNLD
jgi:hypothetical protein